jgi:ADP-glucose pyrophosphorylase
MRFLTHCNGKGLIDSSSEACSLSLIDKDSILLNETSVWSSIVRKCRIENSLICSSIIENSTVINSTITGGKIVDSFIETELVTDFASINNSSVTGKCRIAQTAYLENVQIANATVTGNARLINWQGLFDGREGYISKGIWHRPPKTLVVGDGLTITESVEGFAYCGCYEFPITKWLKIGERYGKKLGLSVGQVDEIRQFVLGL